MLLLYEVADNTKDENLSMLILNSASNYWLRLMNIDSNPERVVFFFYNRLS